MFFLIETTSLFFNFLYFYPLVFTLSLGGEGRPFALVGLALACAAWYMAARLDMLTSGVADPPTLEQVDMFLTIHLTKREK